MFFVFVLFWFCQGGLDSKIADVVDDFPIAPHDSTFDSDAFAPYEGIIRPLLCELVSLLWGGREGDADSHGVRGDDVVLYFVHVRVLFLSRGS